MRYRVFLMLVANSVAAQAPAFASQKSSGPERRARALQVEPKRLFIEPRLLPYAADVSIIRASVLPPSDRIAVHLALYTENDPSAAEEQVLHLRANTLWPVARIRAASGAITVVSVIADRRGRVKREYRTDISSVRVAPMRPVALEAAAAPASLVAGQHGVIVDRAEPTPHGIELHGRAWHIGGDGRAFSALVRRSDVGYTFDLGKLAGHWLRVDVQGSQLLGLSAVSEG